MVLHKNLEIVDRIRRGRRSLGLALNTDKISPPYFILHPPGSSVGDTGWHQQQKSSVVSQATTVCFLSSHPHHIVPYGPIWFVARLFYQAHRPKPDSAQHRAYIKVICNLMSKSIRFLNVSVCPWHCHRRFFVEFAIANVPPPF